MRKNLLAMAVGINQKKDVDDIVKKVSFTCPNSQLLFVYVWDVTLIASIQW